MELSSFSPGWSSGEAQGAKKKKQSRSNFPEDLLAPTPLLPSIHRRSTTNRTYTEPFFDSNQHVARRNCDSSFVLRELTLTYSKLSGELLLCHVEPPKFSEASPGSLQIKAVSTSGMSFLVDIHSIMTKIVIMELEENPPCLSKYQKD